MYSLLALVLEMPLSATKDRMTVSIFESLANADVLDRRLTDARKRMTEEELTMFVKLQERVLQTRARRARVACGLATEEEIAMEKATQKTDNIVTALHEHDALSLSDHEQ